MAGKKPIRWDVPPSCESLMGYAMYLRDQQENLRQSFSQPSRSVQIPLGNGILVSMVLGPVVDFIRVRGPERKKVVSSKGKRMAWNKLPPLVEGTTVIDLSKMTEDPVFSGGYYCTVSVINGKDENDKELPARFSVKPGTDEDGVEYPGWSVEQGVRQDDGTYKVDGKNATLLLGGDVNGECDIIATDGETTLKKNVSVPLEESLAIHSTHSVSTVVSGWTHWYSNSDPSRFPEMYYGTVTTTTITVTSELETGLLKTMISVEVEYYYAGTYGGAPSFGVPGYGVRVGASGNTTGEALTSVTKISAEGVVSYEYSVTTHNAQSAGWQWPYDVLVAIDGAYLEDIDPPYSTDDSYATNYTMTT